MGKLSAWKEFSFDLRGFYWDFPDPVTIKQIRNGKIYYKKIYGQNKRLIKSKAKTKRTKES